jgi:phenylacetate-CoA ligase
MIDDARFEALRNRLGELHGLSHALARQLGDFDLGDLRGPADLALVPVLRKSDLAKLQAAEPPFGGLAAAPIHAFPRLFASPGGVYEPESAGTDPWGAKRAFAASGVGPGDVVVNCFSYHLTPGARILESGALALGCPVIPAGPGNTEQLIAAIAHFRPSVYCGPPDFLKIVLDKARALSTDVSSIRKALVSGAALPPSLRAELESRGVKTRQAYATADLGVIAYETDDADGHLAAGMLVNGTRDGAPRRAAQ